MRRRGRGGDRARDPQVEVSGVGAGGGVESEQLPAEPAADEQPAARVLQIGRVAVEWADERRVDGAGDRVDLRDSPPRHAVDAGEVAADEELAVRRRASPQTAPFTFGLKDVSVPVVALNATMLVLATPLTELNSPPAYIVDPIWANAYVAVSILWFGSLGVQLAGLAETTDGWAIWAPAGRCRRQQGARSQERDRGRHSD